MKKLLVVLLSLAIVSGASAQRFGGHIGGGHIGGGGVYYRPNVSIGIGAYTGFYPYYGLGFNPYYPYGPAYGYAHKPSKLTMEVNDIKEDYKDKVWSVRQDRTLSGKMRRQKIRELKHQRDQEINDTQRNYYKR